MSDTPNILDPQTRKNLQSSLYLLQRNLAGEKIGVLIILEGLASSGKGALLHDLTRGLDPRGFWVFQFHKPTRPEKARPRLWRYWQHIPPDGKIHLYYKSWYHRWMRRYVTGKKVDKKQFWAESNFFEKTLIENGTAVFKFWLDCGAKKQEKRLAREKPDKKKHKKAWFEAEKHEKFTEAFREVYSHTNTEICPWHIIPTDHLKEGRLQFLKLLNRLLEERLGREILKKVRPALLEGARQGRYNPALVDYLSQELMDNGR